MAHPAGIKAVIFDLDGTLLNTLSSLANSHNRMLRQLHYPVHETDAYRYFIGNGARKCVARCLPPGARSEDIIKQALAIQQADYQSSWHADVLIYPGINKVLDYLQSNSIAFAVLSNKDHEFTEQCVSHFFPRAPFKKILGHSATVPHKPEPQGARMLASCFGLGTDEIAFVGDTAMDMLTARACNMFAAGALWGYRQRQELLDAGANCLLSHPDRIIEWFD